MIKTFLPEKLVRMSIDDRLLKYKDKFNYLDVVKKRLNTRSLNIEITKYMQETGMN